MHYITDIVSRVHATRTCSIKQPMFSQRLLFQRIPGAEGIRGKSGAYLGAMPHLHLLRLIDISVKTVSSPVSSLQHKIYQRPEHFRSPQNIQGEICVEDFI